MKQIDHIDGDPRNNDPKNLRVVGTDRNERVKSNPASFDAAVMAAYSLRAGMMQAVWTLRNAANTHEAEAALNKKAVESEGNSFAARILRSYANGLEMDAEKFP
jgi:hypothetical protein